MGIVSENELIFGIGDLHGHFPAFQTLLQGLQKEYGIFGDPDRFVWRIFKLLNAHAPFIVPREKCVRATVFFLAINFYAIRLFYRESVTFRINRKSIAYAWCYPYCWEIGD